MIHSELQRSGKFDVDVDVDVDDDEVEGVWKEVVKTYSKAYATTAIHESEYPHRKY